MPEGSPNHHPALGHLAQLFQVFRKQGVTQAERSDARPKSGPPWHETLGNSKGATKMLPSGTRTLPLTTGGSCRHFRVLNHFSYYSD